MMVWVRKMANKGEEEKKKEEEEEECSVRTIGRASEGEGKDKKPPAGAPGRKEGSSKSGGGTTCLPETAIPQTPALFNHSSSSSPAP